jgi:hypothetical protein
MTVHFEDLWEKCENLHQDFIEKEETQIIINELLMKLNLYKALDEKKEIPKEELEKVKSRTFGEILLTLTNLSLKDRINVFDALATAYKYRAVEHYSEKHQP